jgi:trigger factor
VSENVSEDCKRHLELVIPVADVEAETTKVVQELQKKVKMPGFRPGKVPLSLIRKNFDSDIRQEVIEKVGSRYFRQAAEKDNLKVVGSPHLHDVHFHDGEPLKLTVHFEVAPDFELGDYREIEIPYEEPAVTPEDIEKRLEGLRDQRAEYVNVDPRPVEDGDYAVVSLESLSGLSGEPIKQDEVMLHVGAEETVAAFTENLRGMTPGEEKEIDVAYAEDYAQERLAGKTVKFRAALKVIRRKELPELNDDFAKDLGDFQNLEELREAVRKNIFAEREYEAQRNAKDAIVDKLVDAHEFPVPEAYLDRQIEINVETYLRAAAAQGVDPRKMNLDWAKIKEAQKGKATRDVRASLILDKVADREAIMATNEDVDREVQRYARQEREPVAAVRMKLEKDGSLGRIASRIRTEKTLNFLFEHARKTAAAPAAAE